MDFRFFKIIKSYFQKKIKISFHYDEDKIFKLNLIRNFCSIRNIYLKFCPYLLKKFFKQKNERK